MLVTLTTLPPSMDASAVTAATRPAAPAALDVHIVNGNLTFVRDPLLLGHYTSMALTGTERVMDDLLQGTLGASLARGRYPDWPGTADVFLNTSTNHDNPLQLPQPPAVIVVGLGAEGELARSGAGPHRLPGRAGVGAAPAGKARAPTSLHSGGDTARQRRRRHRHRAVLRS